MEEGEIPRTHALIGAPIATLQNGKSAKTVQLYDNVRWRATEGIAFDFVSNCIGFVVVEHGMDVPLHEDGSRSNTAPCLSGQNWRQQRGYKDEHCRKAKYNEAGESTRSERRKDGSEVEGAKMRQQRKRLI